ncbi:MAG: hypothetical protein AAGH46_04755 [Bacteroidota bacterium]
MLEGIANEREENQQKEKKWKDGCRYSLLYPLGQPYSAMELICESGKTWKAIDTIGFTV